MSADPDILAEVPFFQLLDAEERAALTSKVDTVRHPAGKALFSYGDPGDSLYIVRAGEVEIFNKNDTGDRIVLETARAGDFFGEISLLDGGPRTASAVVTKDLDAVVVDRADLEGFLRQHPAAAMELLTAAGRRLRETNKLLRRTVSRDINLEVEDQRTAVMKTADWISEFSGSLPFLFIHCVLFTVWILLNVGAIGRSALGGWDPFPFGFLTMVVSLEAIILSVFVLLSQNRQVARDRLRNDIEYQVNLKAELEIAHLHEKFDHHNAEVLERLASWRRSPGRARARRAASPRGLRLLLSLLLAGVLLAWLRFARMLAGIGALPNLARAPAALPGGASWPPLSVVVPCRNEEAAVREALSSLVAQDYPGLEVIAVDDRSDDATGAILDGLAADHPGLRVVHVEALPSGWLGKTNAMSRGAAVSTGDFILFTDADVVFAPGALRRAVAWAVRDGLGHAVALPHFVAPGLLERGFVSLFAMFLLLHLEVHALGRPGGAAHLGIGAFNLVRRDAYEAIGGHTRLRLEVVDDVKLGLLLRRSGAPQGAADSGGLVRVRWQRGFVASMRGLLKNFFAGADYRWRGVLRVAVLVPFVTAFPALCLALAPWLLPSLGSRLLAAAAVALPVALLGATARRLAGGHWYDGLLLPIAGLCLAGVAVGSALGATLRGAVILAGDALRPRRAPGGLRARGGLAARSR